MNASPIYIAISLLALIVISVLFLFVKKEKVTSRLTLLTSLAFAFVLAGIFLGEDPVIGYALLGIGLILAFVDIFIRSKKK